MILGTGIDIIEVDRIEKAIKRWGDSFVNYIFTEEEISYSKKHKYPYQHFAGRFAAKEAIFKALSEPNLGWKDIKIINDKTGQPHCIYKNKEFKHKILISISHTRQHAVASATITTKE